MQLGHRGRSFTTILATCSLVIPSVVSPLQARADVATGAPKAQLYLYVEKYDLAGIKDAGCAQADANLAADQPLSETVLDFGAQDVAGNGTIAPKASSVDFTYNQILYLTAYYEWGYSQCDVNDLSKYPKNAGYPQIIVSLGTNNSGSALSTTAGQYWSAAVNEMQQWTSDPSNKMVGVNTVWGASDMEPGFGTFGPTDTWLKGFESGSPTLVNFGSADGCPQSGTLSGNGGSCNNGWNQQDVWLISGGDGYTGVTPELYNTAQPSQWAWISRYGSTYKSEPANVLGPLDDYPSDPKSLTAAQAWTDLQNAFNSVGAQSGSLPYAAEQSAVA